MDKFIGHGKYALEGVQSLTLMSDGMAQPEYDIDKTYIKAAKHMLQHGIPHYYQEIKRLFDADNDWKNL